MTLVIATGGIDLSVGSLMAIAGALAPLIFLGKLVAAAAPVGRRRARLRRPGAGRRRLRPVQRLARHPLPHPADHRDAGAVHRRARHRPGADQRQPPGLQEPGVPVHRPRPRVRHPVPGRADGRRRGRGRVDAAPDRVRPADPGGRRQRARGAARRRAGGARSSAASTSSAGCCPASPASSSSPATRPPTPTSSASAWSSTPSPRSPSAARC